MAEGVRLYGQLHTGPPGKKGRKHLSVNPRSPCKAPVFDPMSKYVTLLFHWTNEGIVDELITHVTLWSKRTNGTLLKIDKLRMPLMLRPNKSINFTITVYYS